MGIQITVDPSDMTQPQKEAVAGFILAYPVGVMVKSETAGVVTLNNMGRHTTGNVTLGAELDPECERLQHDHESTVPGLAFGAVDDVTAVFGSPLAQTAPVAQDTVVADPSLTAHGASAAFSTAPPVSPVASAQVVPPPPAAQTAASLTNLALDAKGLPWDSRIHSESKAKIADGTWRRRRNIDPELVAVVEAELRQVMAAPAAIQNTVSVTVPTPPAGQPLGTIAPPPPPPPATGEEFTFTKLIGIASAALHAKKLTQKETSDICVKYGIPALPMLNNRPDLIPAVAAEINALIASRP